MNSRKLLQQTVSLTFVLLLMGCGGAPTGSTTASTPPLYSARPAAPTMAPTIAIATPTPTADASQWEVIRQLKVEHATTIAGFLDVTFGITAGPDGEVHYTTDGGKTWPTANNSSLCRFGLDIVDEQVAWHCGNPGHVRVSTDGGRNWQAVTDFGPGEPNHCRFLSFLDAKIGWAATPNQLAATTDGGATWTKIALPDGIQKIAAIALRTATDGYLLDAGHKLFVTQDGGKTWSAHLLSPQVEEGKKPVYYSEPTAAVRFLDPHHGLVIMSFEDPEGSQVVAMHTVDGGQTWKQERVPVQDGAVYLAHDGSTLTITGFDQKITVLRYQKR